METVQEKLNATDRCDRCGGQAYLRVTFEFGGELLFCGHHTREHRATITKLEGQGATVHDETSKLDPVAPGVI